jgi:hypothetical protein
MSHKHHDKWRFHSGTHVNLIAKAGSAYCQQDPVTHASIKDRRDPYKGMVVVAMGNKLASLKDLGPCGIVEGFEPGEFGGRVLVSHSGKIRKSRLIGFWLCYSYGQSIEMNQK